jgi:hypothetical protein
MAGRIGGILSLSIDGNQYPVRGSCVVTPTSTKREGVAGQTQVDGFTEMPMVPGAKMEISTVPGLSVLALEAITNSTVVIQLANGNVYTLSNAFSIPPFEIDTAEGKFTAEFGCLTCDEVVASS